jgi:hypothetical protein
MAADNVTDTPAVLGHLKIKMIDVAASPDICFNVAGAAFDDLFFTACGPFSTIAAADCTGANAGIQILDYDGSDCSGSEPIIIDSTAPIITLLGNSPVTIEVGSSYTDAGATALDGYDGDLTSSIVVTGSVDTATVGSYVLSYDVTDSSGNQAVTVTRTVNVLETLSLNDNYLNNYLVYPNPTNNYWIIKSTEIIEKIELYDYSGKFILGMSPNLYSIDINANTLPPGIYLAKINSVSFIRLLKI